VLLVHPPKRGERLSDDLVHIVIAVGREPHTQEIVANAHSIGKVDVELVGACKMPFAPDYIKKVEARRISRPRAWKVRTATVPESAMFGQADDGRGGRRRGRDHLGQRHAEVEELGHRQRQVDNGSLDRVAVQVCADRVGRDNVSYSRGVVHRSADGQRARRWRQARVRVQLAPDDVAARLELGAALFDRIYGLLRDEVLRAMASETA